jgi:hypothetical protein
MQPIPFFERLSRRIRCFSGYHEYRLTGTQRMYGFIKQAECIHCGEIVEMSPVDIDLEEIGGVECLVVRR